MKALFVKFPRIKGYFIRYDKDYPAVPALSRVKAKVARSARDNEPYVGIVKPVYLERIGNGFNHGAFSDRDLERYGFCGHI